MINDKEILKQYAQEVSALHKTGVTTEHSFRGSLQTLLNELLPQYNAVNEPQRSACGAPDYALVGKKDKQPHAYIEAKDLFDNDLRGVNAKGHKAQFDRYKQALSRVAFTDYLSFVFYVDGVETASVNLLTLNTKGVFQVAEGERFVELLTQWADCSIQPIITASRLAEIMAYKARLLNEAILKTLCECTSAQAIDTEIYAQYEAFKHVLLSDLTEETFADLYAQTIVYGMFAARLNDLTPEDFSRQEAATLIPVSNPFLRKIFQHIAGYDLDSRIAWIVDDLAEAFAATDMERIMGRYQQNTLHQDPLMHFYEDFLAAYNPALRKACGVYYTPQPVVSFIVRAIDHILQRDFDFPDGLAEDNKRLQILDPATGTGTFLAETVRLIRNRFVGNEGVWPQFVEESLRPRLHGFELLMAPYTITHLKLDMLLGGHANSRLRVYLTNSLEECHPDTGTLFAQWLSNEATAANTIKRDCPVMVMMGNPPYAVSSSNKGEWISRLAEDYKRDLNERNIQPLSDDYIKFIRLAQYYIERNGTGVMGFITNNSYLDGLIHRRMRECLLQCFDDIYIVNLHGNSKRKETAPDGSKDENVFDIMVGVSILIGVKVSTRKKSHARLHYLDLYGTRKEKYASLDALEIPCSESAARVPSECCHLNWQILTPTAPNYFFVPKDFTLQKEYEKGIKIDELFRVYSSGIESGKDSLFITYDQETLLQQIKETFDVPKILSSKWGIKETSSCRIISNYAKSTFSPDRFTQIFYRPFDKRYIYYDNALLRRGFENVMQHMIRGENVGIMCCRQSSTDWRHAFIADNIAERCFVSAQSRECGYLFPLYLYDEEGERHLNMKTEFIGEHTPEDFFAYIYAVLHSPTYRERYKEFLKIDFPRIPLPTDTVEYQRLVGLGKQLIDLHLMRNTLALEGVARPTYPIAGSNTVETLRYEEGKVYINNTQYFEGVSQTAWAFFIGGYQPAQKWLKDRKARTLSLNDIRHYQRVIATLDKTAELMQVIG